MRGSLQAVGLGRGEARFREAMLSLVDIDDEGEWRRRRRPVADLPEELEPAVDTLVVDRGCSSGELDDVEISHDVVLGAWPRLPLSGSTRLAPTC